MKIAIVGTGISGNTCGFFLSPHHDVDVYEAGNYIGGHANTSTIEAYGQSYDIDSGFMVFNDRTYPNFVRLLSELGVESQASDMSFSVCCEQTGLEYSGSGLGSLFAQRRNLFNAKFLRMLSDIVKFNRVACDMLNSDDDSITMREYLAAESFGSEFVQRYLVPMGAAIWSAKPDGFLEFPARFLISFFQNHGLLQLTNRPQWKTISGRSKNYVQALVSGFKNRIHLNTPVQSITRHEDHVVLRVGGLAPRIYDQVVLATHADQALNILDDATPAENKLLGQFPYQTNEAIVHTDERMLPRSRRAWASWNYHIPEQTDLPVAVTYELNRLQRLNAPGPICVTLNHSETIDPRHFVKRIIYQHPVFSPGSIAAQSRWREINGVCRTWFCGAYWGNGFHEDGVNSGIRVAHHMGINTNQCKVVSTEGTHPIAG